MNEISLTSKFENALALVGQVQALEVKTAADHAAMEELVESIREKEAALEREYKEHPVYVAFKDLQGQKGQLAEALEKARKDGKARQIAWEEAQDAERLRQEALIQAQMQAEASQMAQATA